MKALTLKQPWPALVMAGIKIVETRPWKAPEALIGERLAIHAAEHFAPYEDAFDRLLDGGQVSPFTAIILCGSRRKDIVPRGMVVGTVRLIHCLPIVGPGERRPGVQAIRMRADGSLRLEQWNTRKNITQQAPYSTWEPGHFAWLWNDPQTFAEPVPVKGGRGLWEWDGPAEVAA